LSSGVGINPLTYPRSKWGYFWGYKCNGIKIYNSYLYLMFGSLTSIIITN